MANTTQMIEWLRKLAGKRDRRGAVHGVDGVSLARIADRLEELYVDRNRLIEQQYQLMRKAELPRQPLDFAPLEKS